MIWDIFLNLTRLLAPVMFSPEWPLTGFFMVLDAKETGKLSSISVGLGTGYFVSYLPLYYDLCYSCAYVSC